MKKMNYIWQDRKRTLFGLPLSFTKYMLTEDRLFTERGFFNSTYDEENLYRVRDVRVTRSLGQKLFGVGTVTLYCSDKSNGVLALENIKKPDQVRRFLSELVEQKRTETGVKGREIIGSGHPVPHPDLDGDGNCDAPGM